MKNFAAVLPALLLAASSNGQQYECRTGRSCRCSSSNPCRHDSKYGGSLADCRKDCDNRGNGCTGFEWTDNSSDSDNGNHCELHRVEGNRYNDESQDRSDTTCCWRVSNNPPTPAPTDSKDNKGGKRQRDRERHFLRSLRFADEKEQWETKVVDNNFF